MTALSVAAVLMLWPTVASAGQSQAGAAQAWKAPRTADGQPDLQGVWDFRSLTPLERPRELAEKDTLSDAEAARFEQERLAEIAARDVEVPADVVGNYNQFWFDRGTTVVGSRRTALIVDPADGRMPPLTPEAQQRETAITEARKGVGPDEPTGGGWMEELGPGNLRVRCILGFNSGPPMAPSAYNNNVQLFQSAGSVAILNEMNHNVRIVPLDGRPFGNIPQWVGESRGRWEGETLVVETRNFLRETAFSNGKTTKNLQLTERFTRVDPETLLYEFTVEDPTVWTRPWTAAVEMKMNSERLYEYACHEGNYGLESILSGARAKEREAAKKQ